MRHDGYSLAVIKQLCNYETLVLAGQTLNVKLYDLICQRTWQSVRDSCVVNLANPRSFLAFHSFLITITSSLNNALRKHKKHKKNVKLQPVDIYVEYSSNFFYFWPGLHVASSSRAARCAGTRCTQCNCTHSTGCTEFFTCMAVRCIFMWYQVHFWCTVMYPLVPHIAKLVR